jgi:hypothetical protein
MNKVARILVISVVLALALVITGAQAQNFLAAVSGSMSGASQCNVSVYNVAGGAASVQQSITVGYNASCVNFLSDGDLIVGQERYQGGSYTNTGVYVVDDYSYLGGGQWNTTPTEVCVIDGQSYQLSHGIVADAAGNIYVGMTNYSQNPQIYKYNATTQTAAQWVSFAAGTAIGDIRIDPTGTTLWCSPVSYGVWNFNLATAAHTVQADGGWHNYYGFDINPVNGNIYGGGYNLTVIDQMSATTGAGIGYVAINAHTNYVRSLAFGADWNSDGTPDIYVADTSAANIQVYSGTNQAYLGTITAPASENNLATWSAPVPEPSSLLVMIPGVASLLGLAIRKRRMS